MKQRHAAPVRSASISIAAALVVLVMLATAACSASTEVSQVDAPAESTTSQGDSTNDDSTTAAVSDDDAAPAEVDPTPPPTESDSSDEAASTDEASADEASASSDTRLEPDRVNDLLRSSFAGDELDSGEVLCIVDAISGDSELTSQLVDGSDFDTLTLDQQADVMVAAFDCAPDAIAEEFSALTSDESADLPPEVAECFISSMSDASPTRRDVLIGFAALGAERSVPEQSQGPLVDAMVLCVDGAALSGVLTEELLSDPTLAPAVNIECVNTNFGGETLRPMWEAMVENPGTDFDALDGPQMAPILDAIIGCVSFGKIIAAEAAGDGIILSDDTITCIDDQMADVDVSALITTGEGAEQVGAVMLGCLSPEEMQAMGGG